MAASGRRRQPALALVLGSLLGLVVAYTSAFVVPVTTAAPAARATFPSRAAVRMMAGAAGEGEAPRALEPGALAVVLGYQGGVAELVAGKLGGAYPDAKVRAILSQRDAREGKQPEGAVAGLPPNVEVVSKDLGSVSSADCSGAQLALVSLDKGPGAEAGADMGNYVPLPTLLSAIPGTAPALVAAYANDTTGISKAGPLRIFGAGVKPKEAVEEARAGRAKPCLLVQHGRLFGAGGFAASGAAQPLPFIGGPLQKPVVEESFLKQNMLLALGSSLARSPAAATLRSTLAEAMVRSAGRLAAIKDFSVLSLEGAGPTEADWAQQLAGLDTREGVMVFEKALGPKERVDLAVLQDWLLNDFGSGLSTLAISRVLSSPKPSIVVNTAEGSDIVWQFIAKDLTVTSSGRWCIQLDSKAATLKILRVDAAGEMLTEALPGEEELLQRFSAAFNRLVYSKKLSKRR